MHNRKIFFSDLDGTLLTGDKKISPATMRALRHFTEQGHLFVICTGRPLPSAMKVAEEYGLTALRNLYVVAFNGAEICDPASGKVLHRVPLPVRTAQFIYDEARDWGLYCQTYAADHIVTRADHENLRFNQRIARMPAQFTDDLLSHLREDPCKCLVVEQKDFDLLERFRVHMRERLDDSYELIYSAPWYLEIFSAAAGKGHAVRWLCDHLQIPVSSSLAAGDEENDISMIRAAGLGIAMKNATERVREAADVVTEEDNDHDGLVPFFS
ncbi:MAG: HAD family phosphatase [Lachnospiraceae bacterium]|nr:HAD family phosphatase [Lachnospiraceae bacterium]